MTYEHTNIDVNVSVSLSKNKPLFEINKEYINKLSLEYYYTTFFILFYYGV